MEGCIMNSKKFGCLVRPSTREKPKEQRKKNTKKKKARIIFCKKVGNQVDQGGLEFEPGI